MKTNQTTTERLDRIARLQANYDDAMKPGAGRELVRENLRRMLEEAKAEYEMAGEGEEVWHMGRGGFFGRVVVQVENVTPRKATR